jgi:hypothetical protein
MSDKKVDLLIVLQTHSITNNQKHITRYMSNDKGEISYRCVKSLINSINYLLAEKPTQIKVRLKIFDDHSDEKFLNRLNKLLLTCNASYDLEHLNTTGIMPSIKACYEYGRDNGEQLIYFAQDDYLYLETCLFEMVDAYFLFSEKTKQKVCIYPFDDPYRYAIPPERQPLTSVHLGAKRHWKVSFGTASCFLVDYNTLQENYDLFDAMANHPINEYMEDATLNRLFRERNHLLFTPIPSCALHAQADTEKDLYIDWKPLWDKFADDEIDYSHLFKTDKKIVLNVGAGKVKLSNQILLFEDYKELRLDVAECNPDIEGNIIDLKNVPNESVDAIYASHVLEHVHFHEVPIALKSFMRVLKEGGFALIRVPDLADIASMIKDNLLDTYYESGVGPVTPLDVIYGHSGMVAQGGSYMAHKTGFTLKSMSMILNELQLPSILAEINGEIVTVISKNGDPQEVVKDPKFKLV